MAKVSTKWPKCSVELIFTYHFCHHDYNLKLPFKTMNGILEYENSTFSKNVCVCVSTESYRLTKPLVSGNAPHKESLGRSRGRGGGGRVGDCTAGAADEPQATGPRAPAGRQPPRPPTGSGMTDMAAVTAGLTCLY